MLILQNTIYVVDELYIFVTVQWRPNVWSSNKDINMQVPIIIILSLVIGRSYQSIALLKVHYMDNVWLVLRKV